MSEGVMLVEVIITDLQMKKHHTHCFRCCLFTKSTSLCSRILTPLRSSTSTGLRELK